VSLNLRRCLIAPCEHTTVMGADHRSSTGCLWLTALLPNRCWRRRLSGSLGTLKMRLPPRASFRHRLQELLSQSCTLALRFYAQYR